MVNYEVRSVNSHNLHRVHNCGEIEKQLYSQSLVANALQSISCNQGKFRLAVKLDFVRNMKSSANRTRLYCFILIEHSKSSTGRLQATLSTYHSTRYIH